MEVKALTKLLEQYGGAKKEGDKLIISSDLDVTLFATLGQAQMAMERVHDVTVAGDVLAVQTLKDRFIIPCEDVRAFKITDRKNTAGYGTR